MDRTTKTAHAFHLELTGPPASGKSTFIRLVTDLCRQSGEWIVVKTGPHSLSITNVRPPIPKEAKNGI